jgi:hypothetical protein
MLVLLFSYRGNFKEKFSVKEDSTAFTNDEFWRFLLSFLELLAPN